MKPSAAVRRVAWITGGGGGIGRAVATRLADDGCQIVLLDIDSRRNEVVAGEITASGGHALALVVDVTSEEQIAAAVEKSLASFETIDLLVNNAAAIGPTAPLHAVSRSDWDHVLAVNLTGPFLCSKAVLPTMIPRRSGKIINIASIAGKIAYPLRSPYAVSKAGLIELTLTLAKEVGEHNIQVNAICPGPVTGPRMDRIIAERAVRLGQSADTVRQTYLSSSVLKRMVNADDIAAVVSLLASVAGDNITGQTIDVTAGYAL
jgi:NAD(P)-dependent dehydrogenase (short-subunit alcohol dehydrogenase family)